MLISGVYHAIRTSAIFTSLTVGLRGTDRRFIFGIGYIACSYIIKLNAMLMCMHAIRALVPSVGNILSAGT